MTHLISSRQIFKALLLLACVVSLGGCEGAAALRRAQDLYNRGVELENQDAVAMWSAPGAEQQAKLQLSATPRVFFIESLEILATIDEQKLKADGLVPTARLVKALCLWRLGRYLEARSAADAAYAAAADGVLPRDKALARALRGMVKIDEARVKIAVAMTITNAAEKAQEAERIKAMLVTDANSAANVIRDARQVGGLSPPLKIALIWYEIDACNVWFTHKGPLLGTLASDGTRDRITDLITEMQGIPGSEAVVQRLRVLFP